MRLPSKTMAVLVAIAVMSVFAQAEAAGPDHPLNLDPNGRVVKRHCSRKEAGQTATKAPAQVGASKKGARPFSSASMTSKKVKN